MTLDERGNVYLTVRNPQRLGVKVINPDGKEQAFIATGPPNQTGKTPVGKPSNCCFGVGKEG